MDKTVFFIVGLVLLKIYLKIHATYARIVSHGHKTSQNTVENLFKKIFLSFFAKI